MIKKRRFKVGDIVICTDIHTYDPPVYKEFGVVAVVDEKQLHTYDVELFNHEEVTKGGPLCFFDDEGEMELPPLNNKLNKRLYPNYKEYQGYLIPAEIADKLACKKEQSKVE